MALDCDEQLFHLDVRTTAERSEPESEGPWGTRLPEYYYRYRGQTINGDLHVRARPPRLRAKCDSEVFVISGRAAVETHLQLEAEVGSPSTIIELSLSAAGGQPWSWRNETPPRGDESALNRVRRAERLYNGETSAAVQALAARNPLQAAVALAAWPTGERWRLTLARPLRAREPLRLHARRSLQAHENHWDVPLPVVLGADRMEGEVRLHLTGADPVHLHTAGLRESVSAAEKGATPWRTFRYGPNAVGLTLSGQALASERINLAAIERACLVTYVGENGVLWHHFSFRVANWSEHALPLRLPPGSRPLAVQVDGRWLPRLIPAAGGAADSETFGEPAELALPVPVRSESVPGDSAHRFEVVYTRTLPAWTLWQSLDAPAPSLPVAPLAFRRIWRLPPLLTPLHQERYRPLPGSTGAAELAALPHCFADLFHLPRAWTRLDLVLEDREAAAREALERAVQELRGTHADQTMSLGDIVSEIAFDHLKDRHTLLIDVLALREAGVGVQTPLTIKRLSPDEAAPPWTACGLIAVPARSAILLTAISGRGAALRQPFTEELEQSFAAAATRGQDASGRFHSALSWLHPESVSVSPSSRPQSLDFESERTDWSEWEPIAGQTDDRLMVVRRDGVTVSGLTLAVLLGLLFGMLRRFAVRRRLMLLLLVLGLFGMGVLWLPGALRDLAWWPLLVGCAAAAMWYLRAIARAAGKPQPPLTNQQSSIVNHKGAAVAGMIVLAVFGWNSRAAAPAPATVYLVPGPADAPDKQTVLAPADLLDRLKALARPTPLVWGGPTTVLLDALYEGRMTEGQAEFAAVFSAHCLIDEASTLTLPLAGVQLIGDVLLDGARAAPLALPAPQAGYALPLRGRGRHKIELRFRAPIQGTAEDRNVLFTVPPLPRSRLSWRIPAGAVATQMPVKYGAQWTTRDGDAERLECDLGALPRPVHLHWYQPRRPTQLSYRAAYLWDLGLEANRLTAWLRYRVAHGAVQTLQVDLPDELEVSSATAQRTLSTSSPSWWTRFSLRDWHVARVGGKRTLHLTLPYPISGEFGVTVELLPRGPLSSPATLPLPSPRGIRASGPHYLAHRTHRGLSAQRETSTFLTRIGVSEFAADWPDVPRLDTKSVVAYRITANLSPQLRLRLQHTPPVVQANVDVTVQAGTHQASIQTVADLQALNKDLAAIEWELPAPRYLVVSVAGEDVRTWKQNGSRLLVWLKRTTEATRIHVNGWLPMVSQDGSSRLELDGPRPHQVGKQHTRLRLVANGDLALADVQTRNLQPVKTEMREKEEVSGLGLGVLDFETEDSIYHVNCAVRAAANATARVLTLAEVSERELRFTSTVDYTVRHGELRHVHVRLRNWEREKVEVQAEHVALWPGPRRATRERSWLLPLQPGVRGHYQVTLRGSMPLDEAASGVRMPEVAVLGVERAEYFLAVAGGQLTGQARTPAADSPRQGGGQLTPGKPGAICSRAAHRRTTLARPGRGVAVAFAAARAGAGAGSRSRLSRRAVGRRGGWPALAARSALTGCGTKRLPICPSISPRPSAFWPPLLMTSR